MENRPKANLGIVEGNSLAKLVLSQLEQHLDQCWRWNALNVLKGPSNTGLAKFQQFTHFPLAMAL